MPSCPKCNKVVQSNAEYCMSCGASIKKTIHEKTGESSEKPTAAFASSLIAGILILINGAILGILASFLTNFVPRWIPMGEPRTEAMPGLLLASRFLYAFMIPGIIMGIIVVVAAVMVYQNPAQKTLWGIVILVLSILSIFIGGGFIIGLILGIIGGALALTWKPKT